MKSGISDYDWWSSNNVLPGLLLVSLCFLVLGISFGNAFISIGHVLIFLALVIQIAFVKSDHPNWSRLQLSSWALLAIAAVCIVSVFANIDSISKPLSMLKRVRYELIAIFLVIHPAVRKLLSLIQVRDLLVILWLGSLSIALGWGIVGFFGDSSISLFETIKQKGRLAGLFSQPMTLGYSVQFSVLALVILVMSPKLLSRVTRVSYWALVVTLAITGFALYLSFARGAMLGFVSGLLVFALLRSKKLLIPLIALGIVAGWFVYKDGSRYSNFSSPMRLVQWEAATLTFFKYPVFGVGFRNFESKSVELKKEFGMEPALEEKVEGETVVKFFKGHAHNNYLEAFASTGVAGGLAMIAFCIYWLREAMRSEFAIIFVPLVTAFIVSGSFENTFYDSEVLNCILLIYLLSQVSTPIGQEAEVPSAATLRA